ncbi:alpha/beta hydrolase [Vreelandella sulfidaeris]|uniref:alpha/beta hydrolase n=1 Tax=Vreelandella sulfidaeris TaxID=115553 RepID=UPI0035EFCC20
MHIDAFIQRFSAGLTIMEALPLPQARRAYDKRCRSFAPPDPVGMQINDCRIKGVNVRLFTPQQRTPGRVLFIHGGGFTVGSTDSHHGPAASLANLLEQEVVSVNYRLAPEVSYPLMLADCRDVMEAIQPIALVGDSAGGRLVMDLAHSLEHSPPLGLIYPPVGELSAECLGESAPLLSRQDVLRLRQECPEIIATQRDRRPPATSIEVLTVARDPLTRPIETTVAEWRKQRASVGYRCAEHMVHAALHAQAELPEMGDAWRDFCLALKQRL